MPQFPVAAAVFAVGITPACIFGQSVNPKKAGEALSPKKAQALAQVTSAQGEAGVIRADDNVTLQLHDGELLFDRDVLATKAGTVTFVFCPPGAKAVERTLQANGRAKLLSAGAAPQSGTLTPERPASFCGVPAVTRFPVTSAKGPVDLKVTAPATAFDRSKLRPADAQELTRIDAVLGKDPKNVVARTARAALLVRNGFREHAANEYASIAAARSDLPWAKELVHEYRQAAAPRDTPPNGPVYAVVIGISRYGRPSAIPDLQFADRDAKSFYSYLLSQRGGSIPKENIILLTNQEATKDAIKRYIEQFQTKPRSKLIVFLSGHGSVSNGQGYLVTYGSDPNNLNDSAYPMRALTQLMYGGTAGRVELFVDACRSGHIGSIAERNAINHFLVSKTGPVFGMMASREGEIAWEYKGLGEGHGAFTYFLLRALNSDEKYVDGKLTIYDLTHYVEDKVRLLTWKKQTPQEETSSVDINEAFALRAKKGIPVERWDGKPMPDSLLAVPKGKLLFDVEQPAPPPPGSSQDPKLEELIQHENEGQAVLARYLKGDEIRQEKPDFERGLAAYLAAQRIALDSADIESRVKFFEGRIAIEDHEWQKARDALELAIRLDPASPAAYNALGIAYLEQADYESAAAAFLDTIRRAPYWPYPRHNLALAYAQQGQHELAIDTYRKAIDVAPDHSYLPYNLGLLLEKSNRTQEAEESFLTAREVARKRAEQAKAEADKRTGDTAYTAEAARLGSLRILPAAALSHLSAKLGRRKQALRFYDEAVSLLKEHPDAKQLAIVRHNYAQFLSARKDGIAEARRLWRLNVEGANYIPSRISVATDLLALRPIPNRAGAIEQYRAAVAAEPDNVSQRLRLADLLEATGNAPEALAQVREANRLTPESVLILERLGDLHLLARDPSQARSAYQKATGLSSDARVRRRLADKMAKLP